MAQVNIQKVKNYQWTEIYSAIRQGLSYWGGITHFVQPGEKILLKPNLLSARQPEEAVTTHPEFVRAVIKILKEIGVTVLLGDSPGGAIKGVERVWEKTGMLLIARQENIELVNLEIYPKIEVPINYPAVKTLYLSRIIYDVSGIISLPKLKTHNLTVLTAGVKNLYGLIPGLRKGEYHKLAPLPQDLSRLLLELYEVLKPKLRLTIVDGIVGMDGDGPSSGRVRHLGIVALGDDALALDKELAVFLGLNPEKIQILKQGEKKFGQIKVTIVGKLPPKPEEKFLKPTNWYYFLIPRFLVKILGKFIWAKPVIDPKICNACMLCVESCPVKTIKMLPEIKKPKIFPEKCIDCLCCHELCPRKAITLKKSFLANIIFR